MIMHDDDVDRWQWMARTPLGEALMEYSASLRFRARNAITESGPAEWAFMSALAWHQAELVRLRTALQVCKIIAWRLDEKLPESLCDRADLIVELIDQTLTFKGDPYVPRSAAPDAVAADGVPPPLR